MRVALLKAGGRTVIRFHLFGSRTSRSGIAALRPGVPSGLPFRRCLPRKSIGAFANLLDGTYRARARRTLALRGSQSRRVIGVHDHEQRRWLYPVAVTHDLGRGGPPGSRIVAK